jgi:hypothetical protein
LDFVRRLNSWGRRCSLFLQQRIPTFLERQIRERRATSLLPFMSASGVRLDFLVHRLDYNLIAFHHPHCRSTTFTFPLDYEG